MKELRLHGRGGQGVVTGAEIIVHGAVEKGFLASSFPFFGFEKKGGPVEAYVRVSEEKIRQKCSVYTPDYVVVIDPTLMASVDVFAGLKPDGTIIFNCESPSQLSIPDSVSHYCWLDANQIALEMFGRLLPNTAMLGAFAAVSGWLDVEVAATLAAEHWGEKNADAVRRGAAAVITVK